MTAVDTNILLYVQDPRDPRKQEIAAALIRSLEDGVLLWQVACEYVAASRKLAGLGFSATSMNYGDSGRQRCAACFEAKVTRLYSEDFSHQARVGGLEIVNPFVAA